MYQSFVFSYFLKRFPTDEVCLEEIKKLRYPNGIQCFICKKKTTHYKLQRRPAYSCKVCRNQIYPLAGTIFAKSTTSLRVWFYCLFLMTHMRANISVKQLQRELGVTYKTAWRMFRNTRMLMAQNNGDLLSSIDEASINKVHKWVFFNAFEIKVVEKQKSADN